MLCHAEFDLMNDAKFGSLKSLKWKYRGGNQIIQPFSWIGSPKEIRFPSLIFRNLKTLRKILLEHAECIEI